MKNKSDFKVIPNLSLKGPEILRRLNNRTLIVNQGSGQYSLDEEITEARKMGKADIENAYRETIKNQKQYLNQLNSMQNGR